MQIGPRLPTLGGSVGKAIGSITEPIKKVATSPLGMTVLGTALGGPLMGLATKIPGVGAAAGAIGGAVSKIPGAGKIGSAIGGALGMGGGEPDPTKLPPNITFDANGGIVPGMAGAAAGAAGALGGGLSTMDKWQLALQGLGGVAGGVGQYMDSQAQQNISHEQMAEQQRQFNTQQAMGASRSLANSPLRDQASYMLGHRMMQTPTPFQGGSIMGPGQGGGIDAGASAQHAAAYTPGAGGQGPNDELLKRLVAMLMGGSNATG